MKPSAFSNRSHQSSDEGSGVFFHGVVNGKIQAQDGFSWAFLRLQDLIQDSDGVGRCHTHLLPGTNWSYNENTEQSARITSWRLAEEKSHSQGFTEEAILRPVGRVDVWKGLALLLEGYLSCRGFPLQSMGSQLQAGLPSPRGREPGIGTHVTTGCENQWVFCPPGREESLLETHRGPLNGPTHKILFAATYTGPQQRKGGVD